MLSDDIDVVIALCILAANRVFRRRDNDLYPGPELILQAVYDTLAVIRTIRQKPACIFINVSEQVSQRRVIAHMFSGQLRRGDVACFRIKGDVEFAPCFTGFPGTVLLFMPAVAAMHF